MIPAKALLVSVPLVLAGGALAGTAHGRMGSLRVELAAAEMQGRAEADSYVRTLQGTHAQRQLDLLSRHHDLALHLAAARRDQLLGVVLALGGVLAFAVVRAAERVARELEEAGLPGPPPGGAARPTPPPAAPRSGG